MAKGEKPIKKPIKALFIGILGKKKMEPKIGFEPMTVALRMRCSAS